MLVEVLVVLAMLFFTLVFLVVFKPLWVMNHFALGRHCQRIKNIPYADDDRHTLDFYVPTAYSEDKPLIVFIHGGGWDEGHKDDYKFAGLAFSEMGYLTVIPNYRLYPQVQFPHFIEDVAVAIGSLPTQLTELGLKFNRPLSVILVGHSAGAHSAAMLVSKAEYLLQAQAQVEVKGFVGLAGPYDLPLDDELVVGKFDGVALRDVSEQQIDSGHVHNGHDANPINLASANMPKALLIHGAKDITVGPYHSERFQRRLNHLGVPCQHIVYAGTNHRHLVGALSVFGRFLNPVYKDIERFLKSL